MDQLYKIISRFSSLRASSNNPAETWEYLTFSGVFSPGVLDIIKDLMTHISNAGGGNYLNIDIDDERISFEEIDQFYNEPHSSWKVVFQKTSLQGIINNGWSFLFFTDVESYKESSILFNPFNKTNPIRQFTPLIICIYGIESGFGGPDIKILPCDAIEGDNETSYNLPDEDTIKRQVHIVSSEGISLSPKPFLLTWGAMENELAKPILKASIQTLLSCLVHDFISVEKVIIRGIKNREIPLFSQQDKVPKFEDYKLLINSIQWAYEERVETRVKLITDRLSLDIPQGASLFSSISTCLEDALKQSKQQYGFVILERKEEYFKELKSLLTDVNKQSDLYSSKIRSLLANLLRDVLAALFLVGFSVFAKISVSTNIVANPLFIWMFNVLGLYFIVSFLLQVGIHITDIIISSNELSKWSLITRNYIAKDEINNFLKELLKPRMISMWISYFLIGVLYILVAIFCIKFPSFINALVLPFSQIAVW